ncbi:MAG: tRNA 2-thiouridine synthesizing protein A [Alteromonadaceae bacterium]|jgi:tRNA 2-thiouridine synthesizing protein A
MSHFDTEIDTSGLNCPLPLLKTKKALSAMQVGQRLRVIATDRAAFIDIPVYCEISIHHLITSSEIEDKLIFIIEKGES